MRVNKMELQTVIPPPLNPLPPGEGKFDFLRNHHTLVLQCISRSIFHRRLSVCSPPASGFALRATTRQVARDAVQKEISVLDRIYRIFRILSQFPPETEKTQSAFSGIKKNSFLASWHPSIPAEQQKRHFELSALSYELSFCALATSAVNIK